MCFKNEKLNNSTYLWFVWIFKLIFFKTAVCLSSIKVSLDRCQFVKSYSVFFCFVSGIGDLNSGSRKLPIILFWCFNKCSAHLPARFAVSTTNIGVSLEFRKLYAQDPQKNYQIKNFLLPQIGNFLPKMFHCTRIIQFWQHQILQKSRKKNENHSCRS